MRHTVLSELHGYARVWLKAAITRAPYEMQGLLQVRTFCPSCLVIGCLPLHDQDYIDGSRDEAHAGALADDEMGKSVAIDMVRTLPADAKGGT